MCGTLSGILTVIVDRIDRIAGYAFTVKDVHYQHSVERIFDLCTLAGRKIIHTILEYKLAAHHGELAVFKGVFADIGTQPFDISGFGITYDDPFSIGTEKVEYVYLAVDHVEVLGYHLNVLF